MVLLTATVYIVACMALLCDSAVTQYRHLSTAAPAPDSSHLSPPGVMFNNKKQPLMKARSLPDMEHRMKKRQKLLL